jgi:SAM-dependent methyltransferase
MSSPKEINGEDRLTPSPSVKQFGKEIVSGAADLPILDVACGRGRNSAWLSYLGGHVTALDIDLSGIEASRNDLPSSTLTNALRHVELLRLDLVNDLWPYQPSSVGGIVNIHFLYEPLLAAFSRSLIPGGFLVLETVEARGGNYRHLPESGALKKALEGSFEFLLYKEHRVRTPGVNAATVWVVGKKVSNSLTVTVV